MKRCARCGGDLDLPARGLEPAVCWLEAVRASGFAGQGRLAHPDCEADAEARGLVGYMRRGRRPGVANRPQPTRSARPVRARRRSGICPVCGLQLLPEDRVRIPSSGAGIFGHAACVDADRRVMRSQRQVRAMVGLEDDACAFSEHRCWVPLEQLPWPDDDALFDGLELQALLWADEAILLRGRAGAIARHRRDRREPGYWRGSMPSRGGPGRRR